ncbi:hypothetical protein, partial [Aeromonas salmonicida]|uniref:hypothetical protein n=1 Tax=Aeromonas salmonicida TaxID=645 RepID=UPI00155A006D
RKASRLILQAGHGSGDKPAKALTRKEAELVTKEWFKQYRGASGIDVQIHATQVELETALGLAAKDGLIRRAAFDDDTGTLHVAADTIANPSGCARSCAMKCWLTMAWPMCLAMASTPS